MAFDPQDPIDAVFTEIDDLAEIAEVIGDPLTDVQQTKLGSVILQNTKRLSGGLKKWDEKALDNKTQSVLQADDQTEESTPPLEAGTYNRNPVIFHLANQMDKLSQQMVLLQQQKQQQWNPPYLHLCL